MERNPFPVISGGIHGRFLTSGSPSCRRRKLTMPPSILAAVRAAGLRAPERVVGAGALWHRLFLAA
jgi:hypothetical protein